MSILENANDQIAKKLEIISQNILVAVFGLLPLIFIPSSAAPFEYTKILVVVIGMVFSLIFFSLSTLRSGKITASLSYPALALWAVAIIAFISALLSGDLSDSLIGDYFSIHSAAFVGLLALTVTIWSLVRINRALIMRLFILLSISTIILVLFHLTRLVFGTHALSFGVFKGETTSLIGGWNDLALFLGLAIILSLVALEQLRLKQAGRILFAVVTAISLVMLAIINFFAVWLVLGLVSLVVLVYALTKDKLMFSSPQQITEKITNVSSLTLSLVVFVVAVLFIVGGSAFGGFVNKYINIPFIEVRPSLQATMDVARGVYAENAFLGIGPNRFADAWRLHKDPAINSTVFWNTDFNAGNGYLPTFFVTTGVLGGIAWIVFLILFLYRGIRTLLKAAEPDRTWYFIGVSSFVGGVYIWAMSVIYVPGPVILFLGAMCTGLAIVASEALKTEKLRTLSIGAGRRTGFVFTLIVIGIIIGSVQVLYLTGRHYAAAYTFTQATQSVHPGADIAAIETKITEARALSSSDTFARTVTEYELARMNALLGVPSPTQAQQQEFQTALVNGVKAGQEATQSDKTEPANWMALGSVYSLLASANIQGSYDRALDALTKARDLDPQNPLRYLALAQLEARKNNLDGARTYTEEAIKHKQDYSDALYFLTQIDIVTGKVDEAIQSAKAIIGLEPQNPARYYQLGVLESSQKNVQAAVAAFEQAVRLDPNYANAMYFLALGYDALGRSSEARALLERVLVLNPGNKDVISLINTIDASGTIGQQNVGVQAQPVNNETVVSEEGDTVITTQEPDSNLVAPVNTAPSEENSLNNGGTVGQ